MRSINVPPLYFFIFMVISLVMDRIMPVTRSGSCWFPFVGIILMMTGMALAVWARIIFYQKRISVRFVDDVKKMETGGPYVFSRNPMYLGMTMILGGLAFSLDSLTAFIGPLAFWVVLNLFFIPPEEEKLARIFGNMYLDYKKRVRRWF